MNATNAALVMPISPSAARAWPTSCVPIPPALKIRVHGRVIDISPTAVRTGQDCAHNPAILMRSKAGIGIAREESGYARLGIVHVVKPHSGAGQPQRAYFGIVS